ncbi:hypothetical protein MNEG_15581, partial [Monoraphidium neglectum]
PHSSSCSECRNHNGGRPGRAVSSVVEVLVVCLGGCGADCDAYLLVGLCLGPLGCQVARVEGEGGRGEVG